METKPCSARNLGCIANDFSQCDLVQNIFKKALAHIKIRKQNKTKKTPAKKQKMMHV